MVNKWWQRIDAADIVMIIGLGLMATGLWLFEPIIALVIIGTILWKMGTQGQKGIK